MTTTTASPAVASKRSDLWMIGLAYLGFIALGIPGTLLNIAWSPYMRDEFGLPLDALGTLLIFSTCGYFIASFTSGRVMARLGIGLMVSIGALAAALGLLLYAVAGWPLLLAAALMIGIGAGMTDSGMNIYFAAVYGPRLMNWLHACFGIGATIGPLLMIAVLRADLSWRAGYGLVMLLYAVLTVLFFVTRKRWRAPQAAPVEASSPPSGSSWSALLLPAVWVGILLFLVAAGMEVAFGQWSSTLFSEAREVPRDLAENWVSFYWASFTIGRLLYGAVANRLPVGGVLRVAMAAVIGGAALMWWNPTNTAGMIGLMLAGFAQAPIFPLLVIATQARLPGHIAPHAIGFQISAASIGIALLPGLIGVMAQNVGIPVIAPLLLALAVLIFGLHEVSLWMARRAA